MIYRRRLLHLLLGFHSVCITKINIDVYMCTRRHRHPRRPLNISLPDVCLCIMKFYGKYLDPTLPL